MALADLNPPVTYAFVLVRAGMIASANSMKNASLFFEDSRTCLNPEDW